MQPAVPSPDRPPRKAGSAQTEAGSKGAEAGGSTGGSGEYKDTLVWAQGADVTSLDPHQGKETPAVEVTDQIFDTLTVVDAATGELQPQIAESWDQNSDTSYTFHTAGREIPRRF